MWTYEYNLDQDELKHHGIKGQKWGVRRYQNSDGSLTDAGRKRYSINQGIVSNDKPKNPMQKMNDKFNSRIPKLTSLKLKDLAVSNRSVGGKNQDKGPLANTKRTVDSANQLTRDLNHLNKTTEKISTNKSKKNMDLSSMSDKELRDQINRKMLEQQYTNMFTEQKKGREYVTNTLEIAGSVLAVTSSALSIAIAVKKLKGN